MPTGLPAGWRFLTDDEVRKVKAKKPDLDTRNIVINPELGVDSTYAEVVPEKQQGSANYFTQALRHGTASILPFAGARLGGKLLGLGTTAVTANPLAGIGADIAGSVAAGMGTAAFQDAMAQKYADAHPDSVFAKQYRIIEADRKYSPLSSMILGGALASPVGGGGIGITKGMEGLKNAAKMGAAQAGVEAGIEGLHGEIDPASVFVAGLTGAISGRPSARWRRGERALLNQIPGAKNSAFVEYFAPEVVRDVPRYTPVDEVRSEYKRAITDNPESLLKSELWNPKMAMDRLGEELIALAGNVRKFRGLRAIGELKKQGVPLTEADFPEIIKLAEAKGVPAAVQTYKVLKSQMEGGYRAPDEAVQSKLTESQVLSEANARNIADLSRAQNAQAVQAAAESIVPPETPVKSAAESAEVMMARTAETKDIATQIREIKAQERQVATLKEMWKIIPLEQRAQLDKLIDSLQENLIIRKLDLKRQGGENLLYGDQINEPNKTTIPGTEIPGEGIRPGETAAPVAGEIPGETTSITKPPPIPQKAGEGEISIGGKIYKWADIQQAVDEQIKKKEVIEPGSGTGMTFHSGLPEDILKPVTDVAKKAARTFVSGISRFLRANSSSKMTPQQVRGLLVNRYGNTAEFKYLQSQGLDDYLKTERTPVEIANWIDENGFNAETMAYGMEGKVSEARKEYDRMTHEWYDSLPQEEQREITTRINTHRISDNKASLIRAGYDEAIASKYDEYIQLGKRVREEPRDTSPRATTAYEHVSALNPHEPMPEWTASKYGKNVQRVDVVIPIGKHKGRKVRIGNIEYIIPKDARTKVTQGMNYVEGEPIGYSGKEWLNEAYIEEAGIGERTDYVKWQPDNIHENLPNTLGWAMIQYKTGAGKETPMIERVPTLNTAAVLKDGNLVDLGKRGTHGMLTEKGVKYEDIKYLGYTDGNGNVIADRTADGQYLPRLLKVEPPKKIAVIVEAQSRWGQAMRERRQELANTPASESNSRALQESRLTQDHPLLRDYNRLILKAAIEQARKEGATHIVVSDAETAMMTEGHDTKLGQTIPATEANTAKAKKILETYDPYKRGQNTGGLDQKELQMLANGENVEREYKLAGTEKYWENVKDRPNQEPGMRLNYDKILPKIAEEITGAKGQRISLGEHKNAYRDRYSNQTDENIAAEAGGPPQSKILRRDLIFKNPDGTPKTDVSGYLYPIKETASQFTYSELDKPFRDISTPITLHSGLPENILQPALDKFGKFARSGMSRLLKSGDPLLYRAAKRAEQAKNTYVKQAPYQADVTEARRLATSDDTEQVRKWLWYWRNGLDDKLPALSPHQEEIVRKLQDVVQTQGILKAMPGAPLVQEKSGEFRSVDPNVRFFPSMPSKEVIKVLKDARQNPNNEKFQEYKSDYLLHQMNRGSSAEEAMQNWKDFVGRHTTKFGSVNDPQLEFKGNRREMGESLPLSMQGNPFDALARYVDRTHTDFAWHEFEKDPQVAKGLGLDHNGMGELIPDVVLDDAGKPIEHGSIAGNEDINAIFRDLSSSVSPSAQEFEKLQSIFLTGLVGTRSNIKDILFSPLRYAAVATVKDFMHLPRSWADMLSKEYTKKGLRTGAMRLHRNTAQTLDNTSDLISAIRDNYSFITGAEKVREIGMRGNVSFAENMAKNHVEDNDIPFLKKWGPIDYEKWDPLKLQDYITERLTAYFAGSQDFNELPNWQLRGSMNKATALAPLARWGSGAANRFVDLVIDPLKDGDARPLLKTLTAGLFTAAVYDELNEKLVGIKPKGLSFTEFFNLGGKDAVYTLLSKASAIGLAGIYSDVAFAIAQAAAGETPYGFSSPVMQFPANAFARYSQAIAAMENDGVEGLEAFGKATLALLQDQLQFVRDITTPPREDTGSREERLARHTGYLPPKVGLIPPIANPFSVANMYRTGDSDALARRFEIKRERRQEINPPQNPYRKERGTAAVGFQPDAYYLFLEDAQGKAAADAARERDMKKREENMQVFNDALMKMWR